VRITFLNHGLVEYKLEAGRYTEAGLPVYVYPKNESVPAEVNG